MKRRVFFLGTVALAAASGCSGWDAFARGLAKVAKGANYLQGVIDIAEAGADAFFSRHPSAERESKVAKAIFVARKAAVALESLLSSTSEAIADSDLAKARKAAVDAYKALKELLDELQIPQAVAPEGGAENIAAPMPEAFELPDVDLVESRLSF